MRILFVMAYPGYLRYFDSTITELAARGHEVELYFESLDKQAEGLVALDRLGSAVRVGGVVPGRTFGLWKRVALDLRGTMDFVRYLDPVYGDAGYLRNRAAAKLPLLFKTLGRRRTAPRVIVRAVERALLAADQRLPIAAPIEAMLRERKPDVVFVSPLLMIGSRQADVVAAARALRIPVVAGIASWDHLTTKGLLRGAPDRIVVWNEQQKREAVDLHFVPADRVCVTGAQPFDRWFDREPTTDRTAFCERAGLDPLRPFVLFTGSTASISHPDVEVEFVRSWIAALRSAPDATLREVGILVRPHPYNSAHWLDERVEKLDAVTWPRHRPNPADEADRADYFDSLYHAAAVVGINTSAMIEAAIVRRPVLTVETSSFNETQDGTLHFRYLLPENGGFVQTSHTLQEHVAQLAETLARPESVQSKIDEFVASFVRPLGSERSATPAVADAIETAQSTTGAGRHRLSISTRLLGGGVLPLFALVTLLNVFLESGNLPRRVVKGMKKRRLGALEKMEEREAKLRRKAARLRSRSESPPLVAFAGLLESVATHLAPLTEKAMLAVEYRVRARLPLDHTDEDQLETLTSRNERSEPAGFGSGHGATDIPSESDPAETRHV
jgi:hypothetical protein